MLALARHAQADLIHFDDLSSGGSPANTGAPILGPYRGLTWTDFYVLNTAARSGPRSGYAAGTVSPNNVAYNAGGGTAAFSSPFLFTLDSLYLTAAWNNGLNVVMTGFSGANVVHMQTVTVQTSAATLFSLGWANIDRVTFASSGGVNAGLGARGTQFAMDNLTFITPSAAIPEPGTLLLLGIGILPFTAVLRRQSRRVVHQSWTEPSARRVVGR